MFWVPGTSLSVLRQLRTWQRFQAEPEKLKASHHTCPHPPLWAQVILLGKRWSELSPWSHPVVSAFWTIAHCWPCLRPRAAALRAG